jgi:hypothetical protein
MKTTIPYYSARASCCVPAAGGLFFALALLLSASAGGQELLKNGNMEAPFPGLDPTTNWTLVFVTGGPGDFDIAGQTTEASNGGGGRGGQIRGDNFNSAEAYFKQVVTNITPGAVYTLSIQKMKAAFDSYWPAKCTAYMAAISGTTSNYVYGNGGTNGSAAFSMTVTGSASGQIEVQLHMWKNFQAADAETDYKSSKCCAWFDDVSLHLAP